jgi:lipopolysaccharide export LptBFGC system permease protein LptF
VAYKGLLKHQKEQRQFILTLEDANIVVMSGKDNARADRLKGSGTFPLSYGDAQASQRITKRRKSLGKSDLFAKIDLLKENGIETMPLYVELHKRLALALSPLAFLLMGIPFGIRTSRTETSVGLVISVTLAMLFYVFIIIAENIQNRPSLHPDFLIWVPNIIYQIGGIIAMKRISKR